MLPPTDSLRHQLLKLAEITSSTPNAHAPPPPAYTIAAQGLHGDQTAEEEEDDDDEYDYEHLTPPPPPAITININTSHKIEGNGNTIVLPSSSSQAASGPASALSPSSNNNSSSNPTANPSPSSSSSSSSSASQGSRASKLTTLILTALKDAGVLGPDSNSREGRRQRPIIFNIEAGTILKGNRNLVCPGVGVGSRRLTGDKAASGAGDLGMGTDTTAKRGAGMMAQVDGESRKRRACSEPPNPSPAKRTFGG